MLLPAVHLGYSPKDVDVVELHDCFSANELITYEALGLCEPGRNGLAPQTLFMRLHFVLLNQLGLVFQTFLL